MSKKEGLLDEFKRVQNEIETNRQREFNCIPTYLFNRFEPYFPGIEWGTYYCITANSGIGKSQLMRKLFIYDPVDWVINNPNSGIKLKVFLFSLEESKRAFIYKSISNRLHKKYKFRLSIKELQSISAKRRKVTDDVMEKIEECMDYFSKLDEYVEVIDNIRNPYGVYRTVADFMFANGTCYDKDGNVVKEPQKGGWSRWEASDPRLMVIVITDHVSLTQAERDKQTEKIQTKHESMSKLGEYFMLLRDRFRCVPVSVHQQASDKEKVESNFRGDTIARKLEPSLDGLGNNKEMQRDYNVVMGLFSPARYKIKIHPEANEGYDIDELGNSYRWLSILKDRDGVGNAGIALYFNGACGEFTELPPLDAFASGEEKYTDWPEIAPEST